MAVVGNPIIIGGSGGGGGGFTPADEGKVVSNGSLVAQTSLAVTENGTYDTTLNNEGSVNVAGGGGVIYEETPINQYAINYTPDSTASTALSCGFEFTTSVRIKVSKIRIFARGTTASGYINQGDTVLASVINATVVDGQWNDLTLSEPIYLEPNTTYLVWGSLNGMALKYTQSTLTPNVECITKRTTYYSTSANTKPSNSELGTTYGVDFYVDAMYTPKEVELITKSITANGTYNASDDDADGYSSVTVNVSGGSTNILSGTSVPSSSDGSDGAIYLQYEALVSSDLSGWTDVHESSMSLVSKTSDSIEYSYGSGGSIGAYAYKQIDLTDIDLIAWSITSGSHSYNSYATPRFAPYIYLKQSAGYAADSDAQSGIGAKSRISTDNTTNSGFYDVSSLTGNWCICFNATGCDCTLNYLKMSSASGENGIVVAVYLKVNGTWQQLIGSDIDDVDTGSEVNTMTCDTFMSDSIPTSLPDDGLLVVICHEGGTQSTVTLTIPGEGTFQFNITSGVSDAYPVTSGTTVAITNDGGKRKTFYYYH